MTLHFPCQAHIFSLHGPVLHCTKLTYLLDITYYRSLLFVLSHFLWKKESPEKALQREVQSNSYTLLRPCWSEIFPSSQMYAESLQSKQAEQADSCWVIKSLVPIFMMWKNMGSRALEKNREKGTEGYTMIHRERICLLWKLCSFASYFCLARKTLVFRRAKSRGAVGDFSHCSEILCWM